MIDLNKVNQARVLLADSLRDSLSEPPQLTIIADGRYNSVELNPSAVLRDAIDAQLWAGQIVKVARALKATTAVLGYMPDRNRVPTVR